MIDSPWALIITKIHFYAGIHSPTQSLQQTKHYLQDGGWNYPLLYEFPAVLKAMWQAWCEWEYRESQCQILPWPSSTIWHCSLAHGEWEVATSSQQLCFTSPWVIPSHTQSHRAAGRRSCIKSSPRRCCGHSGAELLPVPGPQCCCLVFPMGCCLVLNWGRTSPALGPRCSVLCFSLLLNLWLQALFTARLPSPVLKC